MITVSCHKSVNLYNKAKKVIPGGTQLFSKRAELFLPGFWPAYYQKARGCEVWDIDGNKYIDMFTMGIGTCILGYADEYVNKIVKKAIDNANMTTLNVPEEVELAEKLCKLHPWAGMVRYARTGGEAMAIAVRIARAKSGKDKVLFCGYHGWHDWYLAANLSDNKALDGQLLPGLEPMGVPKTLKGTAYPFKYNDTEGFLKLVDKHKKNIGVVVLETIRDKYPDSNFLKIIKQVTKDLGIILICDEITCGFRLNIGGAHLLFSLIPDIAVFGKAISNGYPMAAIIGKKDVMDAAQNSFISSTYWTEKIGVVATLATLEKIEKKNIPQHLCKAGKRIQQGWRSLAVKHGLQIEVSGIEPLSHLVFKYRNSLALKTLFTQLMLDKKFLASTSFYASYAHKDNHIDSYLEAVDDTFRFLAKAIRKNNVEQKLKGAVCHAGFKRLN